MPIISNQLWYLAVIILCYVSVSFNISIADLITRAKPFGSWMLSSLMLGKREDINIHPYVNTSIMPLKFPTLPMKFHSTIPPQPVGSERVRNAGIITSIGSFNKYAPPPAGCVLPVSTIRVRILIMVISRLVHLEKPFVLLHAFIQSFVGRWYLFLLVIVVVIAIRPYCAHYALPLLILPSYRL